VQKFREKLADEQELIGAPFEHGDGSVRDGVVLVAGAKG